MRLEYKRRASAVGWSGIELGTGCGVAPGPARPRRGLDRTGIRRWGSSIGRGKIFQLYWNNEKQIQVLKLPFDFIVVTNVFYLENTVEPLISTMNALFGANNVILLGYQIRSPEAHQLFWQICPNYFTVEKVPHEDLHPEYAYEETDVYILRKKMT